MKRLTVCVLVAVACGACQKPVHRLNAPPHGTTENPIELRDMYAQMADNALLADMSISDAHFLPHRAALNTLGEERLQRLAGLVEQYGGTIRFSTDEPDQSLVQARAAAIIAFLRQYGLDTSTELLAQDLPGGRGMDAGQAILIRVNEGRYKAKKSESGGSTKLQVPSGQ